MIPQILIIVLLSFTFSKHCIKHGEPLTGKYNGWGILIGIIIESAILWWGGFWECFSN